MTDGMCKGCVELAKRLHAVSMDWQAMQDICDKQNDQLGLLLQQNGRLHAEVQRLRAAISQTLDANAHLADGDVCTLLDLKLVLRASGTPWEGDAECTL